jgi:hypothetical protein
MRKVTETEWLSDEELVALLSSAYGIHENCGDSIAHVLDYYGTHTVMLTKGTHEIVIQAQDDYDIDDGYPETRYRVTVFYA